MEESLPQFSNPLSVKDMERGVRFTGCLKSSTGTAASASELQSQPPPAVSSHASPSGAASAALSDLCTV